MKPNSTHLERKPVKPLAVLGIGAVVALGGLGAVYSGRVDIGPGPHVVAGSGSAATNTVYTQPVVSGMQTGATATRTPPSPQPETPAAVPGGR
ncbi:MAG: hypothetical protein QOC76_1413 [Mycobacterium sp.]|jgi:hypothetical protein|nr:hypothetical protein [Mycobacterium sp.]